MSEVRPARPIQRVLVGCAGELGARIVHAVESGGMEAVAAFDDRTAGAPHLDAAAYAVHLPGSTPFADPLSLVTAAMDSGSDAVHPGIGGLARSGAFARSVESMGLAFVGPRADHLDRFADRTVSRAAARDAGLEVIPCSAALVEPEDVVAAVERFGVPCALRPARRGGGPAMRFGDLVEATARAKLGFGAPVLVERSLERPRHVVVVVVGDGEGNAIHVGLHERSVGDGRRVLMRECPAPALGPEPAARLGAAAAEFLASIDYLGVGGVEFLVGPDGRAWFTDVDAGLPEGFGMHDAVHGIDLVQAQVALASGEALGWSQDEIGSHGHALEIVVTAVGPGTLEVFRPGGGGDDAVVIVTGYAEGAAVDPAVDAVLVRARVTAPTRHAALVRAKAVVEATRIEGVPCDLDRVRSVLVRRDTWEGDTWVGMLDVGEC